jgi:DNA-binding response OmpR family regulator
LKTLLIVDDDDNIRLLLRDEFTDKGFNIITAIDGEEALVSFFEESIDLVILDLRMPKLDGNQVLEKIRSKNSEVPILMYTANPDSVIDLSNYGNVDLVVKSSDLSDLVQRVETKLNV